MDLYEYHAALNVYWLFGVSISISLCPLHLPFGCTFTFDGPRRAENSSAYCTINLILEFSWVYQYAISVKLSAGTTTSVIFHIKNHQYVYENMNILWHKNFVEILDFQWALYLNIIETCQPIRFSNFHGRFDMWTMVFQYRTETMLVGLRSLPYSIRSIMHLFGKTYYVTHILLILGDDSYHKEIILILVSQAPMWRFNFFFSSLFTLHYNLNRTAYSAPPPSWSL